MKKLCIAAALMLVLFPMAAMAGMTAASDAELQDVSGQTGITLSMTMNVTATGMAWGDNDGFGTYTTEGWVILSGVTLPAISISGLTIDAGTTANATSYLAIGTSGNLISGNLTIGDVVIGSTASATTESIGEIRVTGVGIGFGTILISGH